MATDSKYTRGHASAAVKQVGTYLMSAENVIDFSNNGDAAIAADDYPVIKLPEHAVVKSVTAIVLTAGTGTLNIGDATNTAGWFTALAMGTPTDDVQLATGAYSPWITATPATESRYYPDGGTIDLIPSGAITTGSVWIQVEYFVREVFENL